MKALTLTLSLSGVKTRVAGLLLSAVLFAPSVLWADIPLFFDVEVKSLLCPEFPSGGVVSEYMYRLGDSPTLLPAEVVSQQSFPDTNTASAVLRFPSTNGTSKFNVVGFCRSFRGFSNESNVLSVSNCDHLATYDSDGDGLTNAQEDTNCDNFFSPGDRSNPDNVDTDGDGVRDLVEIIERSDPTNPGSSPRPFIFAGAMFDPDRDGTSNPVVWRGSTGSWFVKDIGGSGTNQAFSFGMAGDTPFTYWTENSESNVGVIRQDENSLRWLFRGQGFSRGSGLSSTDIRFGIFGDNIVLGAWEQAGVTNPAVARLFNGQWTFDVLLSNNTVRSQNWGGNGDIPKVQDYDGDGLFDIAVYRPSTGQTFVIRSSDDSIAIYSFGTGTADHTVRGDYTGDGIDDISFWEPLGGFFFSMTSDAGFNEQQAALKNPQFYSEVYLGTYFVDLPLSWNVRNGLGLFTVVDHSSGMRMYFEDNDENQAIQSLQWGLNGDHQG